MIVVVGVMFCLVSFWIMSYFGRNFVRGGSFVRDSRVSISIVFSDGVFVYVVIKVDNFSILIEFRVKNIVVVISVYR